MLATPRASARSVYFGQRVSVAMSSTRIVTWSRDESMQGPVPVSCCSTSRTSGGSPATACGTNLPWSYRFTPAYLAGPIVSTAVRAMASSVACRLASGTRSARAICSSTDQDASSKPAFSGSSVAPKGVRVVTPSPFAPNGSSH